MAEDQRVAKAQLARRFGEMPCLRGDADIGQVQPFGMAKAGPVKGDDAEMPGKARTELVKFAQVARGAVQQDQIGAAGALGLVDQGMDAAAGDVQELAVGRGCGLGRSLTGRGARGEEILNSRCEPARKGSSGISR